MSEIDATLETLEREALALLAEASKSKGKPAAKEDVLRLAAAVNRLTADVLTLKNKF